MPHVNLDLSLIAGAALVVLGLGVYGLRDVLRFSPARAWAVGGVVFRESVRRRVWLIPPLAMLAVLLLRQLQVPADEADAVRQTLTFCLFASGLVVVVVTLILACTNLPREIDSRVIFTVVTKPLTRLELFAGKVIGFAQLNALLLLAMGLFTWLLLAWMNAALLAGIGDRLASPLEEARRPYLQHLLDVGLLRSERVAVAEDLQVYAEPPDAAADAGGEPRWIYPGEQYFALPFDLPPELVEAVAAEDQNGGDDSAGPAVYGPRLAVQLRLPWRQMPQRPILPGDLPLGVVNLDNLPPAPPPVVSIQVLDHQLFNVLGPSVIADNAVRLPANPGVDWDAAPVIRLSDAQTRRLLRESLRPPIYVAVYVNNTEYQIGLQPDCVRAVVETPVGGGADGTDGADGAPPEYEPAYTLQPAVKEDFRGNALARTYLGSNGAGLAGPTSDLPPPTGVLAFRGAPPAPAEDADGRVGFDVLLRVDPSGDVSDLPEETLVRAQLLNVQTGELGEAFDVVAATARPTYFSVPAALVRGGDFDLRLRNETRGQIITARGDSLRLIVGRQPFAWNLAKTLFVQWLLGLLVATAGLTFSTFVGWPIAVTLVVVMLGGRWVADQLGSALGGSGRQTAEAVFGSTGDVAAKEAFRTGVDALNEAFAAVTQFLPDMAVYGVGDALEQGLVLPPARVGSAALLTLGFALPLTALGYVVLRNKEVAP